MSGQVRVSGIPVHRKDREIPPVNSAVTEYKLTFAEALDMGVNPRVALGYNNPSRNKDITPERLQACVEAGLTVEEMAKGFGSTVGSFESRAYGVKYRLRDEMRKAAKTAKPVQDKPKDRVAEVKAQVREVIAAAGDQEEAAQEIEDALERSTVGAEQLASPVVIPADSAHDEFVHVFGGRQKPIPVPQIRIFNPDKISVAGVELPEGRYTIHFTNDFSKVKLTAVEDGGVKLWKKGTQSYRGTCKAVIDAFVERGIPVPTVYILNPQTMIGEVVR